MLDFFFFNDTATTEIYTLSLHDALPIFGRSQRVGEGDLAKLLYARRCTIISPNLLLDRKSTRLNSSHQIISYAVFCLKKKKNSLNFVYNCYMVNSAPSSAKPISF